MKRRMGVLVAAATMVLGGGALVAPQAGAATTSCATTWGSLARSGAGSSIGSLRDVRAGRHTCYDRVVFDIAAKQVDYRVAYVKAVHNEGQGAVVPLRGGARLQVNLTHPTRAALAGKKEMVDVAGFRTLRQVASGGTFEGYSTIGVGVRARLPFRTFVMHDGTSSRLVLDVAHRW